jgi:hypothetical protein
LILKAAIVLIMIEWTMTSGTDSMRERMGPSGTTGALLNNFRKLGGTIIFPTCPAVYE